MYILPVMYADIALHAPNFYQEMTSAVISKYTYERCITFYLNPIKH